MSITSVQLGLRLGAALPTAAPAELMRALRGAEVTQTDTAPCGFQLSFAAEAGFDIADHDLLQPFTRVIVELGVDGTTHVLMDGFITHQQLVASNAGESLFVVTGEDVSVQLDLMSLSREFPAMPEAFMAATVLADWIVLGLVPTVVPTPTTMIPFDFVPQQAATDRGFLLALAARRACVFYVTPTMVPLVNAAYWGPPPRFTPPSALLDVAVGAASTVASVQAGYDALAPATTYGLALERTLEPWVPMPVLTETSLRIPPLADRPAIDGPFVRRGLWPPDAGQAGADWLSAQMGAQAQTDASTDAVVTLTCDVAPLRLGQVLQAPDVVGVRGAGRAYDGAYYLKSATHRISLRHEAEWDYTESLTLTREGAGTLSDTLETGW